MITAKFKIGDIVYYSDAESMQESEVVGIKKDCAMPLYCLENGAIVTEDCIVGKINLYRKDDKGGTTRNSSISC